MPVGAGRTAKRRDEEFSVLGIYSVFYHDCIMSPSHLRAPKFPLINDFNHKFNTLATGLMATRQDPALCNSAPVLGGRRAGGWHNGQNS